MKSVSDRVESQANKRRTQSLALLASDKRVHAMLTANKVDVKYFADKDFYCAEKIIKIAHNMTRDYVSASDVNQNALCAIKTAINARANNVHMTKHDIECAMLVSCKVSDERAHIVHVRQAKHATARQVQLAISMLKNANIVREIARNVYEVTENDMLTACEKKFADFIAV